MQKSSEEQGYSLGKGSAQLTLLELGVLGITEPTAGGHEGLSTAETEVEVETDG